MRLSCSHPVLLYCPAERMANAIICDALYDILINLSGFSSCLYRTFVTWKWVLGSKQAGGRAPDALEAIIRRLRASAARPPPPLRCALAKTPNNRCYREATFQLSAFLLSPARPVVRGRVIPLSQCPISASRHGPQGFSLSGSPLGLCWKVSIIRTDTCTGFWRARLYLTLRG
jgi:hypothetical protein